MTTTISRQSGKTIGTLTGYVSTGVQWNNGHRDYTTPQEVTASLSTPSSPSSLIHVWVNHDFHIAMSTRDWRTFIQVILNELCLVEDIQVP